MPKPKKDKAMARTPLREPQWYAVHTRAGCEKAAAEDLGRQGFWTWYPFDRYRVRRKRPGARDLVTWIERPHFSRYVFVALRYIEEAIGDVNDAEGVARVVCERFTGRPLQIPTVIMDALMDEALVTFDDEAGSAMLSSDILKLTKRKGNEEVMNLVNKLGRWVYSEKANAA